MEWAEILVIILAIFLAIFLLAGIVLIVQLIRISRQIKAVTSSAERTALGIEKAVAGLTKVSSPLLIMRTVMRQVKRFKRK